MKMRTHVVAIGLFVLAVCAGANALAGEEPSNPAAVAADTASDWAPVLYITPKRTAEANDRLVDTYHHAHRKEWGYAADVHFGRFYVVHPEKPRDRAPLYVVLHSAGHCSWTALVAGFRRSPDGAYNDHGLYHTPDDFYGLYLADAPRTWWGREGPGVLKQYAVEDSPVEKRVLDTIAWVSAKYAIDPDRVYLAGISMGGSGGLGIGMRHGDVFASAMVWVPAGTAHVARRMFFGEKMPAGLAIPDPPVVVNLSAQNDSWSRGQDVLIKGANDGKYALIMGWGPFGHTGDTRKYVQNCGPVLAFPWLEVRRDQAYPVFTGATSDQKPPWLHAAGGGDAQGQINAFFRWKNLEDTATTFAMRIWLEPPAAAEAPAVDRPKESVADVTFRRLQKFKVLPGKKCAWELAREGKTVASGAIQPDASGLLTVPKMTVTTVPAEMRLKIR